MKRLMTLTIVLLLSVLLTLPALAVPTEEKVLQPLPEQAAVQPQEVTAETTDAHETEAFKRQQTYIEQREVMKARRDEAMKIREQNVNSNSPGNTGL